MQRMFLPVIFILILSSCSSSKLENNEVLLSYNIKISQGGGFTGARNGYLIDSTGIVTAFSGLTDSLIKKSPKGKLNLEQIKTINDLFPSILKTNYSENGNMTTALYLVKGNNQFNFSWRGIEPGKEVPAELTKFYKTITSMINNIKE